MKPHRCSISFSDSAQLRKYKVGSGLKKLFILLIILFVNSYFTHAQNIDPSTVISNFDSKVQNLLSSSDLVSARGLNKIMAGRLSKYLSSSGDLVLSRNYAVLNTVGKTLYLGYNRYDNNKDASAGSSDKDKISKIYTIGLKAQYDSDKDFAPLIENKKLANEIGVDFKFTKVLFYKSSRPTIIYDKGGPRTKKVKEGVLLKSKEITHDIKEKVDAYNDYAGTLKPQNLSLFQSKGKELLDELEESAYEDLADFEKENADFNVLRMFWYSLYAYVPITGKKYDIAKTLTDKIEEESFRAFDFGAKVSGLVEYKKHKFFMNLSIGGVMTNQIESGKIKEYSIDTLKQTEYDKTKNLVLSTKLGDKKFYVGELDNHLQGKFKSQFIWFPKMTKLEKKGISFGFNFFLEKTFELDNWDNGLGILFNFRGKEDSSPVNVSLVIKTDYMTPSEDTSFWGKRKIGLSVALPFGSILD